MKPRTKKLLILLAALVALATLALLILPRFVDADSFRPAIERMARERLGRDVTLGRLSVTFLPPSVVVEDVSLAGGATGPAWFQAKRARVRAGLVPLLSGRLEVRGVDLDEPSFRLLRAPDGRWNLLELAKASGGAGGPSKVSVDAVRIRGGHLEVADAFVVPGSIVRHDVGDIDASIDGLSSSRGMHAEVSAQASSLGGGFSWEGRLGPGKQADGKLQVDEVDIAGLAPYLKKLALVAGATGRVTLDMEIARDDQGGARAAGRIAVADLLLGRALRGAKPVTASADIDAEVASSGRVSIRRFDVETGESTLAVSGTVEDHEGAQIATFVLADSRARFADLVALTAAAGVALPLAGVGEQDVRIAGKARVLREGEPKVLREVALDGVRVRGPRLLLVKGASGRWGLPGGREEAPQAGGPRLLARDIAVEEATLTLEDRSRPGAPRVTTLEDASLTMESWAPGKPGRMDLSARVAGGSVKAKGQVAAPPRENEPGAPWDLDVALEAVDLSKLPGDPQAPRAGRLDARVALKGVPGRSLAVTGHGDLSDASFTLQGGRRIDLDMPIDVDALMESDGRVTLRKLGLTINGSPLELAGRVKLGSPLQYDIGTQGTTTLTPQAVSGLLALAGPALPVDIELTEPIQVDLRARSAAGALELEGHAELRKARLRHALLEQPLEIARAIVDLRGDHVAFSDTALRLGATTLSGAMTLTDFEAPSLRFELESQEADLDELFAIVARARAARPAETGGAAKPGLATRLRAEGSLAVQRATFGGLEFSGFTSEIDLHDARLALEPVALRLYSGTGSGRGMFDMSASPVRYAVDVALDGLDVQALLAAGLDYREFSGSGHLEARLEGSAASLEDALRSVAGSGSARLSNGVVGGLNVLQALEKAGVFGETSLAALGTRIARDGLAYDSLVGSFSLSGGTLRLADVVLDGPDARMTGSGDVDMISTRIDLDAVVLFSEALSAQMRQEGSRAAEIFWDDERSRVMLPARLTGTARAPKASIDWNEALGRVAARKFEDAIRGRTSSGSGTDQPGGSTSSQAQDLLGRLLGGRGVSREDDDPAPAQASAAAADPAPRAMPTVGGAPSARIDEARRGGSVLAPDLKLKATLSGLDLSHAIVVVRDAGGGREIQRLERAFEAEIAAFYAGAARDQPASIAVRLNVDGKSLLGSQGLVVSIVPVDGAGRRGAEVSAEVASASLF